MTPEAIAAYWGAIILNVLVLIANIALFIVQLRERQYLIKLLRATSILHDKAEALARNAIALKRN